jgi:hypothetical protein
MVNPDDSSLNPLTGINEKNIKFTLNDSFVNVGMSLNIHVILNVSIVQVKYKVFLSFSQRAQTTFLPNLIGNKRHENAEMEDVHIIIHSLSVASGQNNLF